MGQAVRRELAEETGYEPAILRRIGELLQAGRQEHAGCFIGQAGEAVPWPRIQRRT